MAPGQVLERLVTSARRRERLQRAIDIAVAACIAACVVAIVPLPFVLASGTVPWWWSPRDLALAVAVAVAAGTLVAVLLPLRTVDVIRKADRRLGLQGALVTSMEVLDSPDPVCRLLTRRTAAATARIRTRRAAPLRIPAIALLVPALATVAVAVGRQPRPVVTSRDAGSGLTSAAAKTRLSHDLQGSASLLLSVDVLSTGQAMTTASRLLEIDRALRGGELDSPRARVLAFEAVASLQRESAMPGYKTTPGPDDPSPGGGERGPFGLSEAVASLLGVALPAEDSRSIPAALARGGGQGAGLGTVALSARPERADAPMSPTDVWEFPRPPRSSGRGTRQAGRGEADPDAPGPGERGSSLHTSHLRLTAVERVVVESYIDRLKREDAP